MHVSAAVAATTKSPEAFRTISEVSSELGVPQHVLRFWEGRFAQIKPVKRAGGRRYYRPEDVDLLKGIRALLYHEGFTIKGVQKVLRDRGLRHVSELGRGDVTKEKKAKRQLPEFISAPDEPQFARAAFAVLQRAHGEFESASGPLEDRVKLEALLSELLQLKTRLRSALPKRTG